MRAVLPGSEQTNGTTCSLFIFNDPSAINITELDSSEMQHVGIKIK